MAAAATPVRRGSWFGSIRFRLTVIYSTVLFGLAAVMVGVVYLGLSRALAEEDIYRTFRVEVVNARGELVAVDEIVMRDRYRELEQQANQRALDTARRYTFAALFGLFVTSLGVGWVVAGRALAPIDRIRRVAEDISATDLSRRIALDGPDDELRQLADTFDDMLARLESSFAEQQRFIHEASHELRNPLAVLRTNVEVTLADPEADTEELRQALAVVERSSDRMTRLVDDLLVYARQGTPAEARHPFDAAEVLDGLAAEFSPAAQGAGLTMVCDRQDPLTVVGDPHAVRQALANLLANAVRLAPAGSVVWLRGGLEGPWVWLSVEDQGPGIDPGEHELVFQRFWRSDQATPDGEPHSGLGLTIARQIAESHGGEVRLRSAPGHGAAFVLWLPAPEPAVPRDLAPDLAPDLPPNRLPGLSSN